MSTRAQEREALVHLREQLIGELHTLPYTIYDDATMEALLDARPQSIEALTQVKGFPEKGKRVKGFGEAVVKIFTELDRLEEIGVKNNGGNIEVVTKLQPMNCF